MTDYAVTMPDGSKYRISGADEDTLRSKVDALKAQHQPMPAEPGYATTGTLASPAAEALKETITGPEAGGSQSDWFAKQQQIETQLRAAGKTDEEIQNDPQWQEAAHNLNRSVSAGATGTAIGAAGGELLPVGQAIRSGIGKAGDAVANTSLGRVLPGATGRALKGMEKIAVPTGKFDPIGKQIISDVTGPEYESLYSARASKLGRAAHIVDENERRNAFREIYNDPQFARIKDFENTPLGKKLTATTGRYSEVIRADPAKVPNQVFDTPQSVRDFRVLLKGDQAKVEQYARQYAVESLDKVIPRNEVEMNPLKTSVGNMSKLVDEWMKSPQQEWLDEVPETKRAVEQFADGLRQTAQAQRTLKLGVYGLGVGGIIGEGYKSWLSLLRPLYGGVE